MPNSVPAEVLAPEDYAAAMKELRGTRRQKEVAGRGGMTPNHWNRLENARSRLTPQTQAKVALGLGVEFERFARVVLEHAQRRLQRRPDADGTNLAEPPPVPYAPEDTRLHQIEAHVRASAESLIQAFRLLHELSSAR
jgi:transcriptional regulator with XRE-family HTH domain